MTKEVFLSQLKESMAANHIDRAAADKYLRRFEKIIDATPAEEVEKKIAGFGRPADIAARIATMDPNGSGQRPATAGSAPKQPAQKQPVQKQPAQKQPAAQQHRSRQEEESKPVYSERGEKIFWWTVALTSPIWIFLICAIAALFICAYVAILVITAALIIAEVAIIVGGVLLAVIGIVYGIMQMLPGATAAYIGLYELGLGIKIGGIVMIAAILIYNFVINMAPLALKSLTKFAKFTAKSLWKLVLRARKECGKL